MISEEDSGEVDDERGKAERGEGEVVIKKIVPDDVVDTRPDQYEGDLDEDESDDGTCTRVK
jgi:hypothetical protein